MIHRLFRSAPPGQVVRYLIVGAWNTLFAYGLFSLLTWLLTPRVSSAYVAAMTASGLGSVICITVSFLGHKLFVFRTKGNFLAEYVRSFVVYGSTSVLGLILLPIVMAVLNLFVTPRAIVPYLAGALLTGGTVVVSFFCHQRYTFAGKVPCRESVSDELLPMS